MFHTCTNVCDYRDTKRKWIHNRRGDLNKNIRLQKLGGLLVTYCIDLETENFIGYVNSHLFEMWINAVPFGYNEIFRFSEVSGVDWIVK